MKIDHYFQFPNYRDNIQQKQIFKKEFLFTNKNRCQNWLLP